VIVKLSSPLGGASANYIDRHRSGFRPSIAMLARSSEPLK
jgi:hypothetical protein